MRTIIIFIISLLPLLLHSQNKETELIVNEGKLLYRMEKGSWYGTDHLMAHFKTMLDSVGGYLSYESTDHKINTIFYSRTNPSRILLHYEFDSLPKPQPIRITSGSRNASELENSLITFVQDAKQRAYSNEDDYFKFYDNTSLNFIPLIKGPKRNVFVLTGPQIPGVVLIGNDYKLSYNKKNVFKKKEKIHNSILEFQFSSKNSSNPTTTSMHSHILSKHISSTDICTLLLYKSYLEWNQHIVLSKDYVSIFDLEQEQLITITRKAWNKMNQKATTESLL